MNPEIIRAIILGIVQGITEFFPVSSTAHLILLPWIFDWTGEMNSLTFDVALHAGTLLALLLCFYKDWLVMLLRDRKMLFIILLATIPAGVVGALFHKTIELTLRSPLVIVFSTTAFGILMLAAEKYGKKNRERSSLTDALFIGAAQAIALIPGVSRSGITITAGLFKNFTRESAARFSFLLSTPIIGGATLLEGRKLLKNPEAHNFDLFIIGFLTAFISGFFAIKFLLNFLKKHPLNIFVYYRFALAAFILLLWTKKNFS
ncbi:MAG: undecaprenyl-diphosphatase UppP [Thermodesulfovibrio sp.]|nr:undecaprenyl-diphosphatase UppP [Thermodesulfovibrio sp.]